MFTKLFSSITTSSIWNEDNNTRILWITMLAMSNKDGYVSASVGGLAHEARISKDDCDKALNILSSPDLDSRSKEFDGRRVEAVDGGFQLLNHAKYRAMRSEEERKEYMKTYMAEYRRTKNVNKDVNNVSVCKPPLTAVNHSKPPLAKAEADEKQSQKQSQKQKQEEVAVSASPQQPEASKIKNNQTTEEFLESLKPLYDGIDIKREINKMKAWLLTPRGNGKKLTRRFIVNWLNRCDSSVSVKSDKPKSNYDPFDDTQHLNAGM